MDPSCGQGGCGAVELSPSLLLLLPVLLSLLWCVVLLFYGSWILALLVSKIVNLFLSNSGVHIGTRWVVG